MKAQKVVRAIPLFLTCAVLFLGACHRAPKTQSGLPQLPAGVRMQDVTFHSKALDRQISYRVFLPQNSNPNQKFPVVYLLHGAFGNSKDWSNNSDVGQYARQGIILVMPDGGSSYYINAVGEAKDKYEDYITQDLIADVQARFPARNNRESRAIVGFSMGGFAAIKFALSHPDLFVVAGALSPAIDVPSRRFSLKHADQWWRFLRIFGPLGSKEHQARDPLVLVESADPRVTPSIYLTAGEQEPLLDPIRRFGARLKQRNFDYEFHTEPGGHDWTQWNEQLPGCFAKVFEFLPR